MKKLLSIAIIALAFSGFVHADSQWTTVAKAAGKTWDVKKGSDLETRTADGQYWEWVTIRTTEDSTQETTMTIQGTSWNECKKGSGQVVITDGKNTSTSNFVIDKRNNTVASAIAYNICFVKN